MIYDLFIEILRKKDIKEQLNFMLNYLKVFHNFEIEIDEANGFYSFKIFNNNKEDSDYITYDSYNQCVEAILLKVKELI